MKTLMVLLLMLPLFACEKKAYWWSASDAIVGTVNDARDDIEDSPE